MAMYPCAKCLNNNWEIRTIKDCDDRECIKYAEATCKICGNIVEFGHKKLKLKPPAKAEYKMENGKRYLKINGKYEEVGLFKNEKGTMGVFPYSKVPKKFKLFKK